MIPVCYLGTAALISLVAGRDVLLDLLSGGLLLGAIFMATDYVTSPITFKGPHRLCGRLRYHTMLIRMFGALPRAPHSPLCLANILVLLIERVTRPRPFGKGA